MDDIEIVNKILCGDKQAFTLLFKKYENIVYKYVLKRVQNYEDTQDVVQEIFIDMYNKLGNYNTNYKFFTWMHLQMHSACVDYYRKQKKYSSVSLNYIEDELEFAYNFYDIRDNIENNYVKKEEIEHIRACINKLSPTHSKLLTLKYVKDLHYEEIAKIMEMDYYSVKQLTYVARNKLHSILINKDMPKREVKYGKEGNALKYQMKKKLKKEKENEQICKTKNKKTL